MQSRHPIGSGATYAGSGRLHRRRRGGSRPDEAVLPARLTGLSVIGGIGGFASLYRLPLHRFREPLLASSTDGVGTKSAIAQAMDVHDTIGIDLVAMVVDDLVACGAEPLFLLDYIACGKLDPERIVSIVSGIADGCVRAGCSLVGGETAEHPGLMAPEDYDLAATAVGVVEADGVLGRTGYDPGTWYSAWGRRACTPTATRWCGTSCWTSRGCRWTGTWRSSADHSARSCSSRAASTHPTASPWRGRRTCTPTRTSPAADSPATSPGSSRPASTATIDRRTWTPLPVFGYIAGHGRVVREEMEKAFNMGIGMVAVLAPDDVDRAMAMLTARHVWNVVLGSVDKSPDGPERVRLCGDHPRF